MKNLKSDRLEKKAFVDQYDEKITEFHFKLFNND